MIRMEIQTLSTNQKKWDFLQAELDRLLSEFVKSIIPELPKNIYKVEPSGWLCEGSDIKPYYLYPFNIFLRGKSPTKKGIEELSDNISKGIEFSVDKLAFEYAYGWGTESKAITGISYKNFSEMKPPFFLSKEMAEQYSVGIKEQNRKDKEFDEMHKKDASYDYSANGYKFLGWQNGWREDPPEHVSCRALHHRTVNVSHNNRGSEHSVSCPICMIMSKYDSSD